MMIAARSATGRLTSDTQSMMQLRGNVCNAGTIIKNTRGLVKRVAHL
jgi:hypothetical protein